MKRIIFIVLAVILTASTLLSCRKVGESETATGDTSASVTDQRESAEELRRAFLAKADEVIVNEETVSFTDGSGRGIVTARKDPNNTVILYTSLTTLWYEAGGSVRGCLGGHTASTLYREYIGRDITQDPDVVTVATASAAKSWDVEKIISLRPDLLICSAAMGGYDTIRHPAEAAGIPVIVMEYDDFSDYLKWFKVSCHLTGHPELWEEIALKALDEVIGILQACPRENTPTVFSMFSGANDLSANTSYTVVGGMISAMNADNVVDRWSNTARAERLNINLETVYLADPDVILIQCHAGAEAAKEMVDRIYGTNPVWQSLTAVREGRVYYLEKNLFHNKPNRRFAEAYATLAEYLYPD